MKLPNGDRSWIPREKLENYLLNPSHPTGGGKERFFRKLGYTVDNIEQLEERLMDLGRTEAVAQEESSRHGTKYVVEGHLKGATGEGGNVRTVWILEPGMPGPRFVTAYPI
ncbi:MAG: DUF6883 domain-containing protein [Gemmatimonadota bacterium]